MQKHHDEEALQRKSMKSNLLKGFTKKIIIEMLHLNDVATAEL